MVARGYMHEQRPAPTDDLVTGEFRGKILKSTRDG
jgi:hypothetical protein